jgi:ketosteroid isomerase-like protein
MPRSPCTRHNDDRSPQVGGGTAFGIGVPPAWEYRRHGSTVDAALAPSYGCSAGPWMRQARRIASGLSSFPGNAALALQQQAEWRGALLRTPPPRDTGRAMSQANTEVVRQAIPMGAALEGKVWRGHDEIRAWAQTHPEVWETLLIWAEEFEQVDEELLLVSGHWDAVGRSGVEMSAPATWVFGFRHAKIAYWQAYTSRAAAHEAVGLSE